jgi:gas vesicle protein
LHDVSAEAHRKDQKRIGLSMAVFAMLLAVTTMLGHRTHTATVLLQTRVTDEWAYYQAKNVRAHMYAADADLAGAVGGQGAKLQEKFRQNSEQQRTEAEDVRKNAEKLEEQTKAVERKATHYDLAEIFFEMAIVLCSISLLSGGRLFWVMSLPSTAVGIIIMMRGALL